MENKQNTITWWSTASIRISHPSLDPTELSKTLAAVPEISSMPGESKVRHGDCKSAGYWCLSHRVEYPERPDKLFLWTEQFITERDKEFRQILDNDYDVNVYIGIHCNVMVLGFDLPNMPIIQRLGIPIGIEFFC